MCGREREREGGDDRHTWLGLSWNLGRTNGSDDVLGLLISRTLRFVSHIQLEPLLLPSPR
jgi:hypothetical protein